MISKLLTFFIGIFLFCIRRVVSIDPNKWIFGAQKGEAFVDNSKYLFLYTVKNNPDVNAIWLCQSKQLVKQLRSDGFNAFNNLSIIGIWHCLTAGKAFFSTSRDDIIFNFKKKNKQIINLWHGMPMKKIVYDHIPHQAVNRNAKSKLWDKYVVGFKHNDVSFIPSTSVFFKKILESCFQNKNVFVTGQPRTDEFGNMNSKDIKKGLGIESKDFVVTYMPTHRGYGKGQLNPRIFQQNKEAIEFFKKNNIKILWKFHKNMLSQIQSDEKFDSDVFLDISQLQCDPQEILFVSDLLITDYSSCYVDYLLLKRPVAFYLYDNYEEEDNELYFSPYDHKVGTVCENEFDLLGWVQNCLTKDDKQIEMFSDIDLYHQFFDFNSCERITNYIRKSFIK